MTKITLEDHLDRIKDTTWEYIEGFSKSKKKCKHRCIKNGCGNVSSISPSSIYQGQGCMQCWKKRSTITLELYLDRIMHKNIDIVGEYKNTHTPCLHRCTVESCGYEWLATPHEICRGNSKCKLCQKNKITTRVEAHIARLELTDVRYVSGYKNMKTPCLHEYRSTGERFTRPPSSVYMTMKYIKKPIAKNRSGPERHLLELVQKHCPEADKKRFKRTKLNGEVKDQGLEIDIFIPSLNKGIEFNGRYYHSFEFQRKQWCNRNKTDEELLNHREIKTDYFKRRGIDIIHVEEVDFRKDKEAVLDKVLVFLGIL